MTLTLLIQDRAQLTEFVLAENKESAKAIYEAMPDYVKVALTAKEVVEAIGTGAVIRGKPPVALGIIGAKQPRPLAPPVYKTTKEASQAAKALGFVKINETVHGGQAVFKKGKTYITRDLDGHNGGAWKMADSVKALGSKETRAGTFDMNLNRIGD